MHVGLIDKRDGLDARGNQTKEQQTEDNKTRMERTTTKKVHWGRINTHHTIVLTVLYCYYDTTAMIAVVLLL